MAAGVSSLNTKKALSSSLKNLMQTKPLNRISVREIAEACDLNRQTFYYHFEDVYDLLRWTYANEFLPLLEGPSSAPDWQDRLLQLFYWLDANRVFCLATLDAVGREQLAVTVQQQLRQRFKSEIIQLGSETIWGRPSEEYADFLAEFYCQALSGILESWLRGHLQQSPEALVRHTQQMLNTQTQGLLALEREARQ